MLSKRGSCRNTYPCFTIFVELQLATSIEGDPFFKGEQRFFEGGIATFEQTHDGLQLLQLVFKAGGGCFGG